MSHLVVSIAEPARVSEFHFIQIDLFDDILTISESAEIQIGNY